MAIVSSPGLQGRRITQDRQEGETEFAKNGTGGMSGRELDRAAVCCAGRRRLRSPNPTEFPGPLRRKLLNRQHPAEIVDQGCC